MGLTLGFPTKDAGFWVLPVKQLQVWTELYPSLNVQAEVQKAVAWVQANPSRRKTVRGMPRFLVAWLNRAQPTQSVLGPAQMAYQQWRDAGGCPHTPRCGNFTTCHVVSQRTLVLR